MRESIAKPILAIFEAASLLDRAVKAHLNNDSTTAKSLIKSADIPELGDWLDPIWLRRSPLVVPNNVRGLHPVLPKNLRDPQRMPNVAMKRLIIARDGHHCRFCGAPVIRAEVRKELNKNYPAEARWTSAKAIDQHRGLQVLWLQYDHIVAHSRGGETNMDNMVITCAACNFGRDSFTLEEMEIDGPRKKIKKPIWDGHTEWVGLENILHARKQFLPNTNS